MDATQTRGRKRFGRWLAIVTMLTMPGWASAQSSSSAVRAISVPNHTFLPDTPGMDGPDPFDTVTGESMASVLSVDYRIIQHASRITPAWRDAIIAAGGLPLAVFPQDALLVRTPPSWGGGE